MGHPEQESELQPHKASSTEFEQTEQTLSHLLDLGAGDQIRDFLKNRAAELSESAPQREKISPEEPFHDGIIRPQTEIRQTPFGEGFYLDDPELYEALADALQMENDSSPELPPFARDFVAINTALNNYLGPNYSSHDENGRIISNNFTPDVEDRSIAVFKGQGNATCIVKAAVAHNYATVLGFHPTLILGHMSEDPNKTPEDGHAFGTLPIPGAPYQAIMDFHVPVAVRNGEEQYWNLAFFAINNEKAKTIRAGGDVDLNLSKQIHVLGLTGQPENSYRRYGARNWDDMEKRLGLTPL